MAWLYNGVAPFMAAPQSRYQQTLKTKLLPNNEKNVYTSLNPPKKPSFK